MKMSKVYSNKSIRIALNNAVAATKNQHGMETLTPGKWVALQQYAGALVAPITAHIEDELLTPQMATYLMAVAACFFSQKYLGNKMPADEDANMLFGQTEFVEKMTEFLCAECGAKKDEKKVGRPSK